MIKKCEFYFCILSPLDLNEISKFDCLRESKNEVSKHVVSKSAPLLMGPLGPKSALPPMSLSASNNFYDIFY